MTEPTYIGDGVYASFDGWQIWLAANHHENVVVALEPGVFDNLIRYARTVWPPQVIKLPEDTEGGGL